MQIGRSWRFGEAPPEMLPEELSKVVADYETNAEGKNWTLTWLEGLPQLALDGNLLNEAEDTEADDSWLE